MKTRRLELTDTYLRFEQKVEEERLTFHQLSANHIRGEYDVFKAFVLSNMSDIIINNGFLTDSQLDHSFSMLRDAYFSNPNHTFIRLELSRDIDDSSGSDDLVTTITIESKSLKECIRDFYGKDEDTIESEWKDYLDRGVNSKDWLKYTSKELNVSSKDTSNLMTLIANMVRENLEGYRIVDAEDVRFVYTRLLALYKNKIGVFDLSKPVHQRAVELISSTGRRFKLVATDK
jgi:hypothetical protein